MSYASDAKLREFCAKVEALESSVAAMKLKLEAVEALTIPRPNRNPRDKAGVITKDSTWAQPTTP